VSPVARRCKRSAEIDDSCLYLIAPLPRLLQWFWTLVPGSAGICLPTPGSIPRAYAWRCPCYSRGEYTRWLLHQCTVNNSRWPPFEVAPTRALLLAAFEEIRVGMPLMPLWNAGLKSTFITTWALVATWPPLQRWARAARHGNTIRPSPPALVV